MPCSAIETLENAVDLLRRQRLEIWLLYWIGVAPFLFVALKFERDMTSGYQADRCLGESLLCAAAFVWMSFWKSRFSGELLGSMAGESGTMRANAWQRLAIQTLLQGCKLAILPLAAISVFPLAWTSAFFRDAALEADRGRATFRIVTRRAAQRAADRSGQYWTCLAIAAVFAVVIFANVLALLLALPELFKAFTGYENEWTRASHGLHSGAVVLSVAAAWLATDLLLQAVTVVRWFHAEARRDGRDLLLGLRKIAAALLVIVALGCCAPLVQAAENVISAQTFDRQVNSVLHRDEFGWVREKHLASDDDSFTAHMQRDLHIAARHMKGWLSALGKWIDKVLSRNRQPVPGQAKTPEPAKLVWLLYAVGGVLAVGVVILFLRTRRKDQPALFDAAAASGTSLDVANENLRAEDLPDEEWLRLAREYLLRGEPRLAIRAMYLANLAYLGAQHLITLTKSKSNRLYEGELKRRARLDLVWNAFAACNREYEKAWYGLYDVTPEQMKRFEEYMGSIRNYAEA